MPGIVESYGRPPGGGFVLSFTFRSPEPVSDLSAADVEFIVAKLRSAGTPEDRVAAFERKALAGMRADAVIAELAALGDPEPVECECGKTLVDGHWRGAATIRCSECGRRWGVEQADDAGQWWVLDDEG